MKRLIASVFLCLFLTVCPLHGKDKKAFDWHTGTLVDSSTVRGTRYADGTELRNDQSYYQIDDGVKYVYVVSRSMTMRRDKPLLLTVNAQVKFALDGDDMVIMDENGKEHRLSIEKRILKNAPK